MDFRTADLKVRNAKPKAVAYDLALGSGLSARIAADGTTKTLYWRGKLGGRVIRVRLGAYPAKTVSEAAAEAAEVRSAARNGVDPNLKARRTAAGLDSPKTVRDAVARFEKEHLGVRTGAAWGAEAKRILRVDILPTIGAFLLPDVDRETLTTLVDRKAKALKKAKRTGVAANRVAAVLGGLFSFCYDKGWVAAHPALGLPKPVPEVKRDRVLSAPEIGQAWGALQRAAAGDGAMPAVYARALMLLMLTGCRASEITGLRRGAVDFESGKIEIVAGKTKGAKRSLPMGPAARAVLASAVAALPKGADAATHLFAMPRGHLKAKAASKSSASGSIDARNLSKSARRLVADLGHKRWTPHDFRRTLVTQLHEMGIDGDVVRRIAGHVGADVHAAVYDRSRQLDKVQAALAEYEAFILKCADDAAEPLGANIVSLRRLSK